MEIWKCSHSPATEEKLPLIRSYKRESINFRLNEEYGIIMDGSSA